MACYMFYMPLLLCPHYSTSHSYLVTSPDAPVFLKALCALFVLFAGCPPAVPCVTRHKSLHVTHHNPPHPQISVQISRLALYLHAARPAAAAPPRTPPHTEKSTTNHSNAIPYVMAPSLGNIDRGAWIVHSARQQSTVRQTADQVHSCSNL